MGSGAGCRLKGPGSGFGCLKKEGAEGPSSPLNVYKIADYIRFRLWVRAPGLG